MFTRIHSHNINRLIQQNLTELHILLYPSRYPQTSWLAFASSSHFISSSLSLAAPPPLVVFFPPLSVRIHYVGRLSDGTCFDNSRTRGKPFEFILGESEVLGTGPPQRREAAPNRAGSPLGGVQGVKGLKVV